MTWLPVESKLLVSIAYAAEAEILYLRFRKTGDVYRYLDVPQETYAELLSAESHGRYFLNHIRNDFSYQRLARLTAA